MCHGHGVVCDSIWSPPMSNDRTSTDVGIEVKQYNVMWRTCRSSCLTCDDHENRACRGTLPAGQDDCLPKVERTFFNYRGIKCRGNKVLGIWQKNHQSICSHEPKLHCRLRSAHYCYQGILRHTKSSMKRAEKPDNLKAIPGMNP